MRPSLDLLKAPHGSKTAAPNHDVLPEWDLTDLYSGIEDPAIESDLDRLEADARAFRDAYEGKVAALATEAPSAEEASNALGAAVQRYEHLEELGGRLGSFAALIFQADSSNAERVQLYARVQERLTGLTSALLFFELELNDIEDDALRGACAHAPLDRYWPWLRRLRSFRPYRLSPDQERLSHEKSQTSNSAWSRLFDQTISSLTFPIRGQDKTLVEAQALLMGSDADLRREAGRALAEGFDANLPTFALIFNTLIKDKEIDDRWRGIDRPELMRHLSNDVDPEVVDALAQAVRDAYAPLSHRYFTWKAKQLGQDQLDFWDRLAPLPGDDTRTVAWPEAQKTVLDAYQAFSPAMSDIGRRFFEAGWIDAGPRSGKSGGAFAHPVVPSVHPYILMNFTGKTRDVMTLAHELGHGIHQVLAAEHGLLLSQTPLTLAETASVFGEMLTFASLLDQESDPVRRKHLLASKVEDKISTVVRQIAFYEFELQLHQARRQGELTPAEIGDLWLKTQKESLGPAIRLNPGYETFWCYVSHFVHVPFYVYAYAFGDCLVNSLYALYRNSAGSGQDGEFAERYMALLKAGGTNRYDAALAPFGLDARDPEFWHQGLAVIGHYMDELEQPDVGR